MCLRTFSRAVSSKILSPTLIEMHVHGSGVGDAIRGEKYPVGILLGLFSALACIVCAIFLRTSWIDSVHWYFWAFGFMFLAITIFIAGLYLLGRKSFLDDLYEFNDLLGGSIGLMTADRLRHIAIQEAVELEVTRCAIVMLSNIDGVAQAELSKLVSELNKKIERMDRIYPAFGISGPTTCKHHYSEKEDELLARVISVLQKKVTRYTGEQKTV